MLKLIIVDDESIIRETISDIIDWESLGIRVICLCKNGVEAYNAIIDKTPDIVMTDIRMPGMSGIELIRRLKDINNDIEFVVLSGYSEFEYAKQLMQYGVKHYLLKPCNEDNIIEVMKVVRADCLKRKLEKRNERTHKKHLDNLNWTIVRNVFTEGLNNDKGFEKLIDRYSIYFDFHNTEYQMLCFYYLNEDLGVSYFKEIQLYLEKLLPRDLICGIYMKEVLVVFFELFEIPYNEIDNHFTGESFLNNKAIKYERISFKDFAELIKSLLDRVKSFEVVNLLRNDESIPIYNYHGFIEDIKSLVNNLRKLNKEEQDDKISQIDLQLSKVSNVDFFKFIISTILIEDSSNKISSIEIFEILLELNGKETCKEVYGFYEENKDKILCLDRQDDFQVDFINDIISYVNKNYSNHKLSLKWIAENYLYMNADYVSREFLKSTGTKFSTFLTNIRINKAKELLVDDNVVNICEVANQVGFINNPHYFSTVFKKATGKTPTQYIEDTD